MRYKGYEGVITFVDDEKNLLTGEVIGLKSDGIMFQGRDAVELKKAFEESVDDYLEWCQAEGDEPERPFSGKLNLRMAPELHRELAVEAKRRNKSLNAIINERLKDGGRAEGSR